MSSFHQVKIETLEKRYRNLIDDYKAANNQLSNELDYANRNRLERRIKNIEQEIERVENQLDSLRSESDTNPQPTTSSSDHGISQRAINVVSGLCDNEEYRMELIKRNKSNRDALLCGLYEKSGGSDSKMFDLWDLGDELGFSREEAEQAMLYLSKKKLLSAAHDGMIYITDLGIDKAEAILSTSENPAEYPPADNQKSLQAQLLKHQSNLNKLNEQAAIYATGETPLHLLNQIEHEEEEIDRIESELGHQS